MVNNIHKFIIHVVYNLFPLNEYSEGELRNLMQQFKDEADDLNITITDDKLKSYIQRFDALKNSPKVTEKDLRKYSLGQLIKLVTSSSGDEPTEELDITPDVVYNNDDNTIVIYNGSIEGNCMKFGKGENWCITKGWYSRYRYSSDRGYPTFYLAKNTNLPDSDKLSFVAIQVRDTPEERNRYVYTNRINSPNESEPMDFSSLLSEVPWLREIPNLKNILKYIPLSTAEKETQKYKDRNINYKEWANFPFQTKKQYLVVRKGNTLFSDISNDIFVTKYLPNYPQLATFVCKTNGIIDNPVMLKHLDVFSPSDVKSFVANYRGDIFTTTFLDRGYPFVTEKAFVKAKKVDVGNSRRIYVTSDDKSIVLVTLQDPMKISVYTEEDDYPNIKLNKRTSRFLLDYPDIDTIPFKLLIKLVSDEVLDRSSLNKILAKAKEDPDSALIIKDTEDGQVLIDSNNFTSYKITADKVTSIPIDSEEVQSILSSEENNTGLQDNALKLLGKDIDSDMVNKDTFFNLIKSIPIDRRKINEKPVIVVDDEEFKVIFVANAANEKTSLYMPAYYNMERNNWGKTSSNGIAGSPTLLRAYFEYLRQTNQSYTTEELTRMITSIYGSSTKKEVFKANPPLSDDNKYKIVITGNNDYYLLNKTNPSQSYTISSNTGKLIKANINPRLAAQFLGRQAPEAPAEETPRRRGRPAGGGAPRQAATPAAAQGQANADIANLLNQYGLTNGFNSLPSSVRNRFLNGEITQTYGDRGATRRNGALGRRGRVIGVIASGQSRFYFVRLASNTIIGSVATQPDAQHFIVTADSAFRIPNASAFVDQLQARNLSENAKAIMSLHAEAKPQDMKELKYLLKNKKNETQ
jgi:hypothetical protein